MPRENLGKRLVWNRSQCVKNPDTGKRQRRVRPKSERIIQKRLELAIIGQPTWHAVQGKLRSRAHVDGGRSVVIARETLSDLVGPITLMPAGKHLVAHHSRGVKAKLRESPGS